MQITLPPELEKYVEDQVKTGHYPTADAVVEDALARLRDDQPSWTMEELRSEVDRGLESLERGQGIVLNGKEELRSYFEDKIKVLHRPTE